MDELADRTRTNPIGVNTWRAGCAETCTSGSEGGPQKPTRWKADRALRPDPYTRIMTGQGVLWLASVRDAFSNKVVGWASDARADTDLVLCALNHALRSRNVQDGQLIHHSDKGCQYTALRFTQRLADAGIAPSTGSVGDSFDNALAENLWSTIKTELLYWTGAQFASRAEAESALLRYIDGWYNPRRIQEGLGGLSPEEYEEVWHRQGDPAMIHPEPEASR